jgi:hypothetical protein
MALINQTTYGNNTAKIAIQSKDRQPGGSINSFSMGIPVPGHFKARYITLCEAHFPQTWYVFNSTNAYISFIEQSAPSTTLVAQIPFGNYNVTDPVTIMSAIMTAMNAVGTQTYTVTYNPNTSTLTISAPANFNLLFSKTNDPSQQLGFNNVDTGFGMSFTSNFPIQLSPSGCIYINIDGFGITKMVTSTLNPASGHFLICVTANSGEQFRWQNNGTYSPQITTSISQNIQVSIINGQGVPVPLLSNFTLTFEISG